MSQMADIKFRNSLRGTFKIKKCTRSRSSSRCTPPVILSLKNSEKLTGFRPKTGKNRVKNEKNVSVQTTPTLNLECKAVSFNKVGTIPFDTNNQIGNTHRNENRIHTVKNTPSKKRMIRKVSKKRIKYIRSLLKAKEFRISPKKSLKTSRVSTRCSGNDDLIEQKESTFLSRIDSQSSINLAYTNVSLAQNSNHLSVNTQLQTVPSLKILKPPNELNLANKSPFIENNRKLASKAMKSFSALNKEKSSIISKDTRHDDNEKAPMSAIVKEYLKPIRNYRVLNVMNNFKESRSINVYTHTREKNKAEIKADSRLMHARLCERYLQAKYEDDIISYVLKFTTLNYDELHEFAEIIQRAWRCHLARKTYQKLKTDSSNRAKIRSIKVMRLSDAKLTANLLNDDLKHDLNMPKIRSKSSSKSVFNNKFCSPVCLNKNPDHDCHRSDGPAKPRTKLTKFQKQIFSAAECNNVMFLQGYECMITSKDLDARNFRGCTPLYIAVENNHLNVAKYLLSIGANINSTNENGNNVLHKAIQLGDFRMISYLIHMGANEKLLNECGVSPLQYADRHLRKELNLSDLDIHRETRVEKKFVFDREPTPGLYTNCKQTQDQEYHHKIKRYFCL